MSNTPIVGRFEVRGKKDVGEPLLGSFSYTDIDGSHEMAQRAANKRRLDLSIYRRVSSEVIHVRVLADDS